MVWTYNKETRMTKIALEKVEKGRRPVGMFVTNKMECLNSGVYELQGGRL